MRLMETINSPICNNVDENNTTIDTCNTVYIDVRT